MPGNHQLFIQSVKRGDEHVWNKMWDKAIVEYETALDEFPNDPMTLARAGLVYTQLKRMDEALKAYQRANQSQPNDPVILTRLAEVQERLGMIEDATRTCMRLGNLFAGQQALDKAVQYWEHATQLDPSNTEAHQHLAESYEARGQTDAAVREYTLLIRLYRKAGQVDMAVAATQAALTLAPRNTGVLRAAEESPRNTGPLRSPEPARPSAPSPEPALRPSEVSSWDIGGLDQTAESEGRGSPLEIARDKALSDLAETIFEDAESLQPRINAHGTAARLSKAEIDALIGQALDHQTRGQLDQAITAYRRILEAVNMPAAHFNLGLLYEQELRFEEAIEQFNEAVDHPEYALGSRFALGECYRALGRIDEALDHFIEVLKIVDLQTVRREQADDLIALYENLADSYSVKGDHEQALNFTNSLVEFLSNRGWEDKVVEARKRLDSLSEEGSPISLAELFTVPNADIILQALSMSQEFAKRGKYYLAADEVQRAIEHTPDYLPLHLRLAELLWDNGHSEESVAKLRTIADTYQVRGDVRHSMNIYQRILQMTPMEIPTRTTLIKLFISHGEIDQALDQYMQLADTYYQLAQIDKARETYQEALSFAPRGSTGKQWALKIYCHLGDIDMQRIDWRRAIQDYEQAKSIAPEDEKARISLIELYYKVGHNTRAIRELDELMTIYKAAGKTRKMLTVLEEQVHLRPSEIALRSRMARLYVETGLKEQAIQQLDALGELQLQAGAKKEAAATIRAIIALGPTNLDDYTQLLAQLG